METRGRDPRGVMSYAPLAIASVKRASARRAEPQKKQRKLAAFVR
jgi:hypothetical protein